MTPTGKELVTITIKDLKLAVIIGTNAWERKQRQSILLNIWLSYNAQQAIRTDRLSQAIDYKTLKKQIIAFIKKSRYRLLERLTHEVLNLILQNPKVISATVRIDKPQALRFAKSVSVEISRCK